MPPSPSSPQRRLILAAYTAGVLALTLLPVPDVVGGLFPRWFDKVVHCALFAVLAALLYWDQLPAARPGVLGIAGPAVALAGLVELAQGPLPGRTGDVWDFVFGAAGALVGYGAAKLATVAAIRRGSASSPGAPPR